MVVTLIYICGVLLAICILALIIAGIKGAFSQGVEIQRVGTLLIAVIAFVVAYIMADTVVKAALIAMIVMLIISFIAMLFTGLRGVLNI